MTSSRPALLLITTTLLGCAASDDDDLFEFDCSEGLCDITGVDRLARAEIIRDTAAEQGLTNAALLAGIGQVETGLAHCWSEAKWACRGPESPSCSGGPVIAGSADGPCSAEQGGLGMFQFDAGTYRETIDLYGDDIVTLEGNVAAVVPFLVDRAMQSVPGIESEQEALDWMNSIPIVNSDPNFQEWVYFVSWRYNGCKGCSRQARKYAKGTLLVFDEMGENFWSDVDAPWTDDDCAHEAQTCQQD